MFPSGLTGTVLVREGGAWLGVDHTYLDKLEGIRHSKPRSFCMAGFCVSGQFVFVSAKGPYNSFKALVGRALRPTTYTPAPGVFESLNNWVPTFLNDWIQGHDPHPEEWLRHLPGPRARVMQREFLLLLLRGFRNKDGNVDSFVKMELLDGNVTELIDRMIQAPKAAGLRAVGPSMWSLTKALKRSWNADSVIFYASVSPIELSRWFNRVYIPGMVGGMTDVKQFDGSYSRPAWDFIYSLYERTGMFNLPFVRDFLDAWKKPRGKMSGRGYCFKYQADYMNASGRPDTALANALLNGLMTLVSLTVIYHDIDIVEITCAHVEEASRYFYIAVVGDDSLFLTVPLPCYTSLGFSAAHARVFSKFGFGIEMELTYRPFCMVFLGMRPYEVAGTYYFARTIGRCLYKYSYCLQPEKYDLMAWFHGKAYADSPGFQCVPILKELITCSLNFLDGKKRTAVVADPNKPWQAGNVTPAYDSSTLRQVASGYDISVNQLVSCIEFIQKDFTLPCILEHPVLDRICSFDAR